MAEVRTTKIDPDQTTVGISIQLMNENVTPPEYQEGVNDNPPTVGQAYELGKTLKQASMGDLEPAYTTDDATGYGDLKEQKVSKKIINLSDITVSGLARTEDKNIVTYLNGCYDSDAVTQIDVKYAKIAENRPQRSFTADMWLTNLQVTRASAELRKLEFTLMSAGQFDDSKL